MHLCKCQWAEWDHWAGQEWKTTKKEKKVVVVERQTQTTEGRKKGEKTIAMQLVYFSVHTLS